MYKRQILKVLALVIQVSAIGMRILRMVPVMDTIIINGLATMLKDVIGIAIMVIVAAMVKRSQVLILSV